MTRRGFLACVIGVVAVGLRPRVAPPVAAAPAPVGIAIRFVRGYDIVTDRYPTRLDVIYGAATVRPELACRVAG